MAAKEVIYFRLWVQLDPKQAAPACPPFISPFASPGRSSPVGSIRLVSNRTSHASDAGGQGL
jgi:hypothetical protein